MRIKVPARICFFGDHQDYLGLPVIAGTIDRHIELKAYPIAEKELRLWLKDLDETMIIPLQDGPHKIAVGDFFRSGMAVLRQKGFVFEQGYQVEISGTIPLNAGLSSSSALVVAWIRFLVEIQEEKRNVSDTEIGHWAYESEVLFFNLPGGLMDQYTIAQGGLLYIDTRNYEVEKLTGSLGSLVVAESGMGKETHDILKNAREYQQKAIDGVKREHPCFGIQDSTVEDYRKYLNLVPEPYQKHWYAAIHNYDITKSAKKLLSLKENHFRALGRLMNAHQRILEECIQNTPSAMVGMMNAARNAGALGAKTIGSGGGGCMVAMVQDNTKEKVREAFLGHGAKAAYEVKLVNR